MQDRVTTQTEHGPADRSMETTCCIVGSGPAGAMLALLLARKGIPVVLLEAAKNFDRDFRGETLHPHALEIMHELGLDEKLLRLAHDKIRGLQLQYENDPIRVADISHMTVRYPYIAMMPQAQFLDFIVKEAQHYPNFQLIMSANVRELIMEAGIVRGVRYRKDDSWHEIRALLTVGADGRGSRLRTLAQIPLTPTAPPLHLLWFRLTKSEEACKEIGTLGHFARGSYGAIHNRGSYWQVAWIIPVNSYPKIHEAGLPALREKIARCIPEVRASIDQIQDWKQVTLLSVQASRATRWSIPGLLLIGDAAHVISPLGGFGINLAIQDAVVTANLLSAPLQTGQLQPGDLQAVQQQRMPTTRLFQVYQSYVHRAMILPLFSPGPRKHLIRYMLRLPIQRFIAGRLIAHGVGSVKIQ
jgi:2-polyprenyl-6-methoxyphenol hydroxylase-like FAD-dependent oxidoreductase